MIEHKLYWARAETQPEAQYLAAILNAPVLSELVRPYQSVGAFGARDFDKYVWRAPVPTFDAHYPLHARLVALAGDAGRRQRRRAAGVWQVPSRKTANP